MAKKTCPNGHIFDPNIYGDQCPLCPAAGSPSMGGGTPPTQIGGAAPSSPFGAPDMKTHIAGNTGAPAPASPAPTSQQQPAPGMVDAHGPTMMRPNDAAAAGGGANRTVIRRAPGQTAPQGQAPSRKLVGFLITYNRDPNGKAFNIYEGRNFIGRDASCDVSIPDDDQMSGRHMSILYRAVDDKFKFRDEQSSNGTFVNKELLDAGELENYDIIRAGGTIFIFLAIPRI